MKKTIAALLAVMMLTTAFAGCTKKDDKDADVTPSVPVEDTVPTDDATPTDDVPTDETTPVDGEVTPAE